MVTVKLTDIATNAAEVEVEVGGISVKQYLGIDEVIELPLPKPKSKNVTLDVHSSGGRMVGGFK